MSTKDDNGCPVLYGVSHLDGLTPVRIRFNPSGRGILIDNLTTIAFNASIVKTQNSTGYPLATGTSSADNNTVLPWVVHATTGAVLVDF